MALEWLILIGAIIVFFAFFSFVTHKLRNLINYKFTRFGINMILWSFIFLIIAYYLAENNGYYSPLVFYTLFFITFLISIIFFIMSFVKWFIHRKREKV